MTIKEIAAKYCISRQTVYNRLKVAGISIDSITIDKSGVLTDEGVKILDRLFTVQSIQDNGLDCPTDAAIAVYTDRIAQLEKERDAIQQACDVLQARLDGMTETVNLLTSERNFLRTALTTEQTAVKALQAAQTTVSEQTTNRKLTFMERITGRLNGKK